MKARDLIFSTLVLAITGIILAQTCGKPQAERVTIVKSDTVFVRDTLILEIPIPETVTVVRTEKVYLPIVGDTVFRDNRDTVLVEIPIEQKTYQTEDFRAVIEGFNPRLIELEIYPMTRYINTTIRTQPKWAVTAGAGVGSNGKEVSPYVGVTFGRVLFSR
jgi:hypothetical protein